MPLTKEQQDSIQALRLEAVSDSPNAELARIVLDIIDTLQTDLEAHKLPIRGTVS